MSFIVIKICSMYRKEDRQLGVVYVFLRNENGDSVLQKLFQMENLTQSPYCTLYSTYKEQKSQPDFFLPQNSVLVTSFFLNNKYVY
jgi:hypothetical protein